MLGFYRSSFLGALGRSPEMLRSECLGGHTDEGRRPATTGVALSTEGLSRELIAQGGRVWLRAPRGEGRGDS